MTYNAISQSYNNPPPDTSVTCIPNVQLKKAINRLEFCKVMESELALSKEKVKTLENLIFNKDKIIQEMAKQDSLQKQQYQSSQKVIQNNNSYINNLNSVNSLLTKQLKRQKIKKWGTLAVGLIGGYLISK